MNFNQYFFFFFPSVFYYYNFILLQVKHTQKKKQQNLHRINKEIKRKKHFEKFCWGHALKGFENNLGESN